VIAAALATAFHAAAAQARRSDIAFTMTRITLDLRLDYANHALAGTETLTLRNAGARPATAVPLLLNRLMTVARVTDARGGRLQHASHIAVFRDDSMRQVNATVITLARAVGPGDSTVIVVHYGGRLVGYVETGSLYVRDRIDRDFTILREDAYAFPVLGVPEWSVNRTIKREPFTFAAQVTVPDGLVVATGGRQVSSTKRDSLVTWMYESAEPVPFLNITIGPYRALDRGGVRLFHFPADSTGARMLERATSGALGLLTKWYGPIGQEVRLTIMEIPEGWGSQASLTGGIIETADAFRDSTQLHQVYHELSHLWNPPDLDVPSPRWNEGLASFLEWRLAQELDGWNGWDARLDRMEQSLRNGCEPSRPCATVPFADYGKSGVTTLSYQVGAAMFSSLFTALGSEAFDRTYREFFQAHRLGGATGAHLVEAFVRANPRSAAILADWYSTTRWNSRLRGGESLRAIVGRAGR
jgi:hypothetical protein